MDVLLPVDPLRAAAAHDGYGDFYPAGVDEEVISALTQRYLSRPSAKERILTKAMHSRDNRFQAFCEHLTRAECAADLKPRASGSQERAEDGACMLLHFEPIFLPHTDPSFGHCSYLNTCHRMTTCKYLHFQLVAPPPTPPPTQTTSASSTINVEASFHWQAPYDIDSIEAREAAVRRPVEALVELGLTSWIRPNDSALRSNLGSDGGVNAVPQLPAQWIDCDLKTFDFSMLGKFDVIVADPPWDIHMSLPYGTMTDDDMRAMPFPMLQDEGLLFLWVTGRAMELGRELLNYWGYTRIDELIWVKIGQTQRLIRTGRTGHWLNHTKEHCLVAAKVRSPASHTEAAPSPDGQQASPPPALQQQQQQQQSPPPRSGHGHAGAPPGIDASHLLPAWLHATAGLATDVIVSEVRDTSRKPDELYGLIERLCPGGRKVELFGRKHNMRRGWLTLGNQLRGDSGNTESVHDSVLRERLAAWRAGTTRP
ncbi:methyltransferase [Tilletia horrida]|nr:methyltransferase [Tilletia horrida]